MAMAAIRISGPWWAMRMSVCSVGRGIASRLDVRDSSVPPRPIAPGPPLPLPLAGGSFFRERVSMQLARVKRW